MKIKNLLLSLSLLLSTQLIADYKAQAQNMFCDKGGTLDKINGICSGSLVPNGAPTGMTTSGLTVIPATPSSHSRFFIGHSGYYCAVGSLSGSSCLIVVPPKPTYTYNAQQNLYCPWGGTLSGTTCVATTVECKTIYEVGSTTNFQEQVDPYKPLKLFCTNSPIPVLPPQAVSTDISKKTNYDYATSKNVYGY
jgi:hypothetical protein